MKKRSKVTSTRGFTAVKFGWGVFGADPLVDVQLVEAAREALGSRRDFAGGYRLVVERTAKEAIQVVRSIEPFARIWWKSSYHPEELRWLPSGRSKPWKRA